MAVFATTADLTAWLPADTPTVSDAARLLARASDVITDAATGGYWTDDTDTPTDPYVAARLRDATCAQVEQWLEVGEDNDVAGHTRSLTVSGGGLSTNALPSVLAPRARRILRRAGLIGGTLI